MSFDHDCSKPGLRGRTIPWIIQQIYSNFFFQKIPILCVYKFEFIFQSRDMYYLSYHVILLNDSKWRIDRWNDNFRTELLIFVWWKILNAGNFWYLASELRFWLSRDSRIDFCLCLKTFLDVIGHPVQPTTHFSLTE